MELAMGEWDETCESQHRERAHKAARRLELHEAQRLLEHFTHPEDLFDEIHPDDAHHDLQITLYRGLARLNCLFEMALSGPGE